MNSKMSQKTVPLIENEGNPKPSVIKPEVLDLFTDISKLRINPTQEIGLRKIITFQVRKPNPEEFFRVHSESSYTLATFLIEAKDSRETFIVSPELWNSLATEPQLSPRNLVFCASRQGAFFVWPLKLPDPNGRENPWISSAHEAANLARSKWVRMASDMSQRSYVIFEAMAELPEPNWPADPFPEILRKAFQNKVISNENHVVLKTLRGEI